MRDQPGNNHDKEGRPLAVAYIRVPAALNPTMTEYVESRHREEQDMLVREAARWDGTRIVERSEEHTSELQSLMRISYAVFCLKKKKPVHYNNKTIELNH